MKEYVPYLVFGLTTGSIYGIAAMGLVLTYKTSGLFNFAHGAVGAAAAFVFYTLRQEHDLPWPLAALIAVVVFGVGVGLVLERMAESLAQVPTTYKIVGTVGLLLAVRGVLLLVYGDQFLLFHTFLPQSSAFSVSGVGVTVDNVITILLGLAAATALYLLFQRTRAGTQMRAVVDDPALLDMSGTGPTGVRRRAWCIGSTFAAASGVLFAAQQGQLDATLLSLLVVQAFGAAALGAFTSLPLAYAGGIAVGLVQKLVSRSVAVHPSLQGLDLNIPFLTLFVVLLVLPRSRLVELGKAAVTTARHGAAASRARSGVTGLGVAVAAVAIPSLVGAKLPVWTTAATQVSLFLSVGLLVRVSGQVSLCQVGLAAVGASTFAHALHAGVPWGFALLLAGLATVPVGAIVAIPAIRLSGLFLALATLGFGVLLAQFFYLKSYMFGLTDLSAARPGVLGLDHDKGYYYLLIAIAGVSMAAVAVVERSRLGRLLRGLADSPTALSTLGASTNITRVLVFCIAAFLAGLSGALYAGQFGSAASASYPYVSSLVVLGVVIISGRTPIAAAVLGPVLLYVVPGYLSGATAADALQTAFGVGAIGVAVLRSGRARNWFGQRAGTASERAESTTTARRADRAATAAGMA